MDDKPKEAMTPLGGLYLQNLKSPVAVIIKVERSRNPMHEPQVYIRYGTKHDEKIGQFSKVMPLSSFLAAIGLTDAMLENAIK